MLYNITLYSLGESCGGITSTNIEGGLRDAGCIYVGNTLL